MDDAQKHVFCAELNKGLYMPMVHRSMYLDTNEQGFVKEVVDDAQKHVLCALLNKGL